MSAENIPSPDTAALPVNAFDLIPEEHHDDARLFFHALRMDADQRGVTVAEALADVLRPYLRVLRRNLGVEAFEERGLTVQDARGNILEFAFIDPATRRLRRRND